MVKWAVPYSLRPCALTISWKWGWSVPNEVDYVIEFNAGLVRVRFTTDGALVTTFIVQLEVFHKEEWKPVRRYDDYHGSPHLDFLDRWGRESHKEWLDVDRNMALNMAIQDFKEDWRRYVADFLKGELHG